jgi:hypothetical protein
VITNAEQSVMLGAITEVVSNVATTAGVVAGGAPIMTAPAPAGTDEASALATANVSESTADFLAVAANGFLELARYAGTIGTADASYALVDEANAAQFL